MEALGHHGGGLSVWIVVLICSVENSDTRPDQQERLIVARLITKYICRTGGLLFTICSVGAFKALIWL